MDTVLNANPTVQTFEFFINKENTQQQMFMNEIIAENTGEHLNLEIKEQDFDRVSEIKSIPFVQSDFQVFEKLHNKTFPDTYYDAKTIKERLSSENENVLKVLKNESNELQGYAYFEIDIEMEEASLEYIGISNEFQNRGLGTMMLKNHYQKCFHIHKLKKSH